MLQALLEQSLSVIMSHCFGHISIYALPRAQSLPKISFSILLHHWTDQNGDYLDLEDFPQKSAIKPPVLQVAWPLTVSLLARWPIFERFMASFTVYNTSIVQTIINVYLRSILNCPEGFLRLVHTSAFRFSLCFLPRV